MKRTHSVIVSLLALYGCLMPEFSFAHESAESAEKEESSVHAEAPKHHEKFATKPFDMKKLHWGAEIEMMPGSTQGGQMTTSLTLQSDTFEAYAGAAFYTSHGDPTATNGSTDVWMPEFRVGKRYEWCADNYLTAGIDYAPTLGAENGIRQFPHTYTVGPYVGFARRFTNSNAVITAFVIPYEYQSTETADATGAPVQFNSTAVLIDGGIGIDFLI